MRRRFAFELVFLVVLATALVLAHEGAAVLGGMMAAGWAAVAVFEWASSRPGVGEQSLEFELPQPIRASEGFGWGTSNDGWIVAAVRETAGEWPEIVRIDFGEDTEVADVLTFEEDDLAVATAQQVRILASTGGRRAQHRFDPLAGPIGKRGWRRQRADEGPSIDVSDEPPFVRPLPSRAKRQD